MSKALLIASLIALGACAPRAEEPPAQDEMMPMQQMAPMDTTTDTTMVRDTTGSM